MNNNKRGKPLFGGLPFLGIVPSTPLLHLLEEARRASPIVCHAKRAMYPLDVA